MGRSDLELRGLSDYASTGSRQTHQSDARDSEPLLVSVAGARAEIYYLTPAHPFYVTPTFQRRAGRTFKTEERILSCNDTSQEGRYGFESSNKEDQLVLSLVRPYTLVLVLCIWCATVCALHQQSRLSLKTQQCRLLHQSPWHDSRVQLIQAQSC